MKNGIFRSLSVEPAYANQRRVGRYKLRFNHGCWSSLYLRKRKQPFLVSVGWLYDNAGDAFFTIMRRSDSYFKSTYACDHECVPWCLYHCESSDFSSNRCFSSSVVQGRLVKERFWTEAKFIKYYEAGLIDKNICYFMHINISLIVKNVCCIDYCICRKI